MKKVRIYTRKNRAGFYVQWRENGRRITKQCNTQTEADQFANLQYMLINNDVYTAINLPWDRLKQKYLLKYDIKGYSAGAKYEAKRTLDNFERLCGFLSSRQIDQGRIDDFILGRIDECKSKHSLNKDISRLRAFLNWMKKNRYHPGGINIDLVKAPPIIVNALTTPQIRTLLTTVPDEEWRIRILVSLVTGLRSGDVDNLLFDEVDLEMMSVQTVERKTQKIPWCPLPDAMKSILKSYKDNMGDKTAGFFTVKNRSTLDKQWRRFRPAPITRQDLRKTNKTLLQKIGSIDSIRGLLGHSDAATTQKYYTDTELILRWKINQLPVSEWLLKRDEKKIKKSQIIT